MSFEDLEDNFEHNGKEYNVTGSDDGDGTTKFTLGEHDCGGWRDLPVTFSGPGTEDELKDLVIEKAKEWLDAKANGTLWITVEEHEPDI